MGDMKLGQTLHGNKFYLNPKTNKTKNCDSSWITTGTYTYPKQPSKRIVKIVKVTTATTCFMTQFPTETDEEMESRNQFSNPLK